MKKQIPIAGFRKGKEFHYSTSVTATKGEQAAIWLGVLVTICAVLLSLFVWKSMFAFFFSVGGGIVLCFGIALFCIFRPKHREERLNNETASSRKVDEAWNMLPGGKNHSEGQ